MKGEKITGSMVMRNARFKWWVQLPIPIPLNGDDKCKI
jgi:hypothetical protein